MTAETAVPEASPPVAAKPKYVYTNDPMPIEPTAASERHRQARVDEALRTHPPNHEWAKDIGKAEAHLAKVSEGSRPAACRVAVCDREIAKAHAEIKEAEARRAELEQERASIEAAIAVGEHTDADAARLTDLCELLPAGDQPEMYVAVGEGRLVPVQDCIPEVKRIRDRIAALELRRAEAVNDYLPWHRSRLAAQHNVLSLRTTDLGERLARLQSEYQTAGDALTRVSQDVTYAQHKSTARNVAQRAAIEEAVTNEM